MKQINLLILATVFSFSAKAQIPAFTWAKKMGGTIPEFGACVNVDLNGDVISCGYFEGTADFDPGVGVFNLISTPNGWEDAPICKLDASGNFVWAEKIGGASQNEAGSSITTDAAGNIYMCGYFGGTCDFDPGVGTFNMTTPGNGYILKVDAGGNFVFAKQMGASGACIKLDNLGNIYTVGTFSGTADFDPGVGTFNLTSFGGTSDIFISKLDPSGNFLWAKQLGGNTGTDVGISLALDGSGNVYTTGYFGWTADFDPGVGVYNLVNSGSAGDIFISKLDGSGNFGWANRIGNTGFDQGNAITVDAGGNVFTTGEFQGTTDFDPGVGTFNMISTGTRDIFVSKLDASGNFVWAKHMGGTNADEAFAITLDNGGNIYTTGNFQSFTADFDPGVGTFNLTRVGSAQDCFISKLDASGNFVWAGQLAGPSGNPDGRSVFVDSFDNLYLVGYFSSTTDFDAGVGVSNLVSAGQSDIFVVKYGNCVTPAQPGTISGPTPICQGTTNTYSITAVSGATSYTWVLPGGWTGSSTTTSINATASSTSGTISVTANNSCGSSSAQTLAVTVNTIPATPGTISGPVTICSGSTNTYSITAVSGATSYTWVLPGGWTGTSTTNSINATASATSGNVTVTANNSCGSSSAQTLAVTVNTIPATPGTISGPVTICSGTTNTYSITAVSGATSYTWVLPGGWTGTSTTTAINATASTTSGTISVTANNSCGSSTAQTLAVTVNTIPTTPGTISGPTTVCNGATNTYSITAVSGATSYTWVLPGGWTGTSTTTSISATANSTGGTISVTANNACGSSTPQTLAVTVCSISTSINPGTPIFCNGNGNATLIANPTGGCGPINYLWTPSGQTGQTATSLCAGSYTLTVTNSIGCTATSTATITQPTPVTTNTSTTFTTCGTCCDGTASVIANGGSAPYTYLWQPGNLTTATLTGLCNGSYTVCVTDANGCTTCQTVNVSFNVGSSSILPLSSSISIYPNPFNENVNVDMNTNGEMKIYNLLGENVFNKNVIIGNNEIDLSNLESGVYFLKIITSEGSVTKKIIKE